MVASEHRTEWVQPIVVDKAGTHEATVTVAAIASVLTYLHRDPADAPVFDAWLSGPFTKSVRRAPSAQLEPLAQAHGGALVRLGAARAVAFKPTRYTDLPRDLSRLQVSGTDLPRQPYTTDDGPRPPVRVAVDQSLTTGKAAAQAAHALFAWVLQATAEDIHGFLVAPLRLVVEFVDAAELARLAEPVRNVPIRDNGFTEVAPNTLTAVAVPDGPSDAAVGW